MREFKTSAWLAEKIKAAGFAVTTGVGGTGIVAVLNGKEPGPVVALRADMDALAHVVDGQDVCVHSCGHDAHCAMVLTAAEEIAKTGIKRGTLKILFQPAEEKLFGATRMIEAGVLDDVEIILGIHLRPGQEAKSGQATPALYHGSSYIMEATITGQNSSWRPLAAPRGQCNRCSSGSDQCDQCDSHQSRDPCHLQGYKAAGRRGDAQPDSGSRRVGAGFAGTTK